MCTVISNANITAYTANGTYGVTTKSGNMDATEPTVIGEDRISGTSLPYYGMIAEVGYYNKPLSSNEVQTLLLYLKNKYNP